MGISVPITSPGVVPFIQQPGPSTAADAHTLLVSPDGWTNYRYTEEDPSTCRHLVDKMVSQNIATDFPSWDHLVPTSNQVKSSSIASASSANNGLTRPRNTASFGTSVGQEKTLLHAKLNASSCPGWRTWLTTSWTSPDPPARMNEFSSLAPTLSMPFNKSQSPPPAELRFTATSVGGRFFLFQVIIFGSGSAPTCGIASQLGSAAPQCVLHIPMCFSKIYTDDRLPDKPSPITETTFAWRLLSASHLAHPPRLARAHIASTHHSSYPSSVPPPVDTMHPRTGGPSYLCRPGPPTAY